ncbi:MAG: DUF4129 domain-containing protein [Candidatus Natronoplasma sp.]
MDKKTAVGSMFVLFLLAAWLIGNLMNFEYGGAAKPLDLSHFAVIVTLIPFVMVGVIFYKGRTKMFLFLFSFALFWIITPIFFHAIGSLYIGLAFLGLILLMVAFKKGYISSKKVALMTGVFIALGAFLFYVYSEVLGRALYNPVPSSPITWKEFDEGVTFIWDKTGGATIDQVGAGGLMLVMILVLGGGFFLYQKLGLSWLSSEEEKAEKKEKMESDISSTVDKTITELHEGKDIKSSILRCYQRMCIILEEKGVDNEDFMTPREFERTATEKLAVPRSKISNIREIFEVAKYSSHQLEEKEKERAVNGLKELRDELE